MVLAQLMLNGLITGMAYVPMAVGFSLIKATTRVFHVAHGATFTVAVYACYALRAHAGLGLVPSAAGSLLVAAAVGVLAEWLVYAPLARRGAPPLVALISSLGVYVALVNAIAMAFGDEAVVLRTGAAAVYGAGPVSVTDIQVAQLVIPSVIAAAVLGWLRFTPIGREIRAVRDQPTLAPVVGIDPWRLRTIVFALGSALAGATAVLLAADIGGDPNAGLPAFLTAAVATTVGGSSRFEGALVGSLLLGVLQGLVVWGTAARWIEAATFLVLVAFLALRPQGLPAGPRRAEEL